MILIYNHFMIVCICKNINSKKIVQALRSGLTFDDLKVKYGLGSQCGSCLELTQQLVVRTKSEPIGKIAWSSLISFHKSRADHSSTRAQADLATGEKAFL